MIRFSFYSVSFFMILSLSACQYAEEKPVQETSLQPDTSAPPVEIPIEDSGPAGLRGIALRPSFIILRGAGQGAHVSMDVWFWKNWAYRSDIHDQVTPPDETTPIAVEWTIQDSHVATLNPDGEIIAVAPGETEIRARLQGHETTAVVHVDPVERISEPAAPSPLPTPTPTARCQATTCVAQGKRCGTIADGCGGTLDCGTCSASVCQPVTCSAQGSRCGMIPDGCGGTLDCGACPTPSRPPAPPPECRPTTCAAQDAHCGAVSNGCGASLDCGICTAPHETCGGSGTPHVCGRPLPVEEAPPSPGARYPSRVVSHRTGTGGGFGEDRLPDVVLGPPRGGGRLHGGTDVYSLGVNGEIILEFTDYIIFDGSGDDFVVFENAFEVARSRPLRTYSERGFVAVSNDGVTYYEFPCDPHTSPYTGCAGLTPVLANADIGPVDLLNVAETGGDRFDLATVGLTTARFVRIRDGNAGEGPVGPGTAGFDLDAVGILHGTLP